MSALIGKLRAKARSIAMTVLTTVAAVQLIPGVGPVLDAVLMLVAICTVWLVFKLRL
jgi:hypothetical protein